MKMKSLATSLVVLAALAGADANAFYAGLGLGESKTKTDGAKTKNDVSYTAAVGLSLPIPLIPIRAEVEYLSLNSKEKELDNAETTGFGANAYVGLPLLPIVKPYIGFGVASLKQEVKDLGGTKYKSKSATVPQYMIGLDVDVPLLPVGGGIEYRYIDTKFDFDQGVGKVKSKIESVLVKARVSF
jgi:opacity protein-like surface antigen